LEFILNWTEDHRYDWREAILNPEHARAYWSDFSNLFRYDRGNEFCQRERGDLQQAGVIRHFGEDKSSVLLEFFNWAAMEWCVKDSTGNLDKCSGRELAPSSNCADIGK